MNTNFLCKTGLAMVAGLLIATAVQAQVAAPRLNSVGSIPDFPANPAVVPWEHASQAAVTIVPDVTVEFDPGDGTPVQELGTGDGTGVLLRGVGESIAAELDYTSTEVEQSAPATGTTEFTDTRVSLALLSGDWITVGIGQESEEVTDSGGGESTSTMPLVGGTLKLGETFYVGGTYGTRTDEQTQGTATAEGDGDVNRIGLAFHSHDGGNGYHVEVHREAQGLIEVRDEAANLVEATEEEAVGATLEVIFGHFALGFETLSVETDTIEVVGGISSGLFTVETDRQRISLGWVPEEGFAVSVAMISEEENDLRGTAIGTVDATTVALAWLF